MEWLGSFFWPMGLALPPFKPELGRWEKEFKKQVKVLKAPCSQQQTLTAWLSGGQYIFLSNTLSPSWTCFPYLMSHASMSNPAVLYLRLCTEVHLGLAGGCRKDCATWRALGCMVNSGSNYIGKLNISKHFFFSWISWYHLSCFPGNALFEYFYLVHIFQISKNFHLIF